MVESIQIGVVVSPMSAKYRIPHIGVSSKILYGQYRILCLLGEKLKKWKTGIGLIGSHYRCNTSIGVNYSGTVPIVMSQV